VEAQKEWEAAKSDIGREEFHLQRMKDVLKQLTSPAAVTMCATVDRLLSERPWAHRREPNTPASAVGDAQVRPGRKPVMASPAQRAKARKLEKSFNAHAHGPGPTQHGQASVHAVPRT
jgi:hypothetical protein